MKKFWDNIVIFILSMLFVSFVFGLFYLDFKAYKQRFPNAAGWTYIFQRS